MPRAIHIIKQSSGAFAFTDNASRNHVGSLNPSCQYPALGWLA
jgi:hypothetical protein